LDFGCGDGPVISHLLEGLGYRVRKWDPFFFPDQTVFERKYDFIILSEVMEHFHDPEMEFKKLFSMLNPGGMILCLTEIYSQDIDFASWRYKDDETHVFFYTLETLNYIAGSFGASDLKIDGRLIIFHIPITI
jgi:2-polyprenyl-3-methyl-5-hydroxy-6-metoxy-1,4-benzoquinol methylase